MPPLAEAFVRLRPEPDTARTFEAESRRELGKAGTGIAKEGAKHGKAFGGSFVKASVGPFRSIVGLVGGPLVGAFAAVAGVKVFAGFVADARESIKVGRLTTQVIKTTGGAAKISADQVGALATAISNKTGVDDEAIQSGANLLLTFTSIRNEVGKGNDIFNQATSIITDMSAALGQDMKSSAIQVGKALNDPIKGVTALQRVGVSFTESQRKQIETLVKSGRTLDAQKVILRELGREFGGAAAAAGTPMDKLKVIIGNVGEQIGGFLVPVIDKAAGWLGARLPAASAFATKAFGQIAKGLALVRGGFTDGLQGNVGFAGALEQLGNQARAAFEVFKTEVLPRLKDLGKFLVGTVIPAVAGFTGWLIRNRDVLIPLAAGIGAIVVAVKVWMAATKAFLVVQAALNAVLALNPIGVVILAVIGIATALVVAYKRSETFRKIVDGAFRAVRAIAVAVFDWIKANWPLLLGILTGPIGIATVLIIRHWDQIKTGFALVVSTVTGLIAKVLGAFLSMATAAGRLPGPLGAPFRAAAGVIATAKDKIDGLHTAMDNLVRRKRYVDLVVRILGTDVTPTAGSGAAARIANQLAAGGWVPGSSPSDHADNISARLTAGEFVVKRPTARKLQTAAPGFLDALNAGQVDVGGDKASMRAGLGEPLRFAAGGSVPAVQRFIRSTDPLPYVWGGAGPFGYDCSGLVGAVYGMLTGKGGGRGQRYFTTGSIGSGQGFRPGLGAFSVGVTPGIGHMAGNLAGLGFEARSTASGIIVGRDATSPRAFARHFYLPGIGGLTAAQIHRTIALTRPAIVQAIFQELGFHQRRYDLGGWLPPGRSIAVNNTGRPERVIGGSDPILAELRALRKALASQPIVVQMDSRPVARAVRNQNTRNPSGW